MPGSQISVPWRDTFERDRARQQLFGIDALRAMANFDEFLEHIASGGRLHVWGKRFDAGNGAIHRWIKEQPRDAEGLTGPKRYQQAMEVSAPALMDHAAEVLEQSFGGRFVAAQVAFARHMALMAAMRSTRFRADGEVMKSAPPSLFDEQLAAQAKEEAVIDVTADQMLRAAKEMLRGAGYEIEDEESPTPKVSP